MRRCHRASNGSVVLAAWLVACGGSAAAPSPASDAGADGYASAAGDARSGSTEAGTHDGQAGDATPASDARGPDGAPASDATSADAGFTPGAPIGATAGQWTWVPFPEAVCANGTSTGIGVNLGAAGARVLIYLEGGGACWDATTCYTLMTAANFATGYGQANFAAESADAAYLAEPGGFFDRAAAANPFKDYSYVYVPYCTGDVFGGDNVVAYGANTAHFVGFRNMGLFLQRIVPTFPASDRVVLAGSSAGGFGAAINWSRVQQAFGATRVDLIDDSGTAMPADVDEAGAPTTAAQRSAWNLDANLPAGCSACASDLSALYGYYNQAFPAHRAALLSYTADTVLPTFFGISTAEFTTGLTEDVSRYTGGTDSLRSFVVGQAGHVLFFSPQLATSSNVSVQQFIAQMTNDTATWTDEGP